MPDVKCLDEPATILKARMCLHNLSKDLRGQMQITTSKAQRCREPECATLKVVHAVRFEVRRHEPCDAAELRALDGRLSVARLVTAFDQDGLHRGVHAGDFVWEGRRGVRITGRLSGVTNVGTHRAPAFDDCQRCNQTGVMEGRLCGRIVRAETHLTRAEVVAAYRILFDPGVAGGEGALRATLEGVVIRPCR